MNGADLHSVVKNGFFRLNPPASSTSIAGLRAVSV